MIKLIISFSSVPTDVAKHYNLILVQIAGRAPLHLLMLVSDHYPKDACERMLDLLLKAGADPNMPVQGGRVGKMMGVWNRSKRFITIMKKLSIKTVNVWT